MPVEHPLNDLDTELRALLAVDPSPGFPARVRMRVAGDRMARNRWVPLSLGAVAAAVLVAAFVVFSTPPLAPPAPPLPPQAAVRGIPMPSPVPDEDLPPRDQTPSPRPPASERRRHAVSAPPAEVEVIVDRRQRAGVDRLIALASAGTVLEFQPVADPAATVDIVVEPLDVPLLIVDPPARPAGAERSDS